MRSLYLILVLAALSPLTYGDQGGLISSAGGTLAAISIANPPGTLSIAPPGVTFTSNDGSTSISATFSSSNTVESCSGGGKGGHITCSYTFTGSFNGTLTVNGITQAINGATTQVYGSKGIDNGVTGYNSAYIPFYFTDGNARILRSDDLSGTNAIAYGTQGSGIGQFYGPSGIALDSTGRIYIVDTYNDRIVRVDDLNGTNWTSFGTYGSGAGQFAIPQSISIDPAGHIWVLDNGNGRLIRMDDMNGTNWTVVGTGGSGVGQFSALSSAPGFDSLGRIYVADAGNRWIVRFDDLNFTNWTTLSQSQPVGPYIYQFGSPTGVVVDPVGKIYVADLTNVIRVDDMTGANWSSISLGANTTVHTIAVDSSGMVLIGNGYNAQVVDSEAAVFTSSITGLVDGVYVSVYGAVPIPLPSPRPSAIGFTPPGLNISQNVGTTSPPQPIAIRNFGGSPLNGANSAAVSGGFAQTNNCPATLSAGSNCLVSITFTPSAPGTITGTLIVMDDSGNMGTSQSMPLSGTGTTPAVSVIPGGLAFAPQLLGTTSTARTITVESTGTGPLPISSVTASGPFSQSNNCSGAIAPGSSCTIQVTFAPLAAGLATGSLAISDSVGTQTVTLSGSGTAPVGLSPASLSFGSLALNNTSAAKTVTLTNRLSVALGLSGVTASGPFAVSATTCGTTVAAGGTCTVSVTFTPAVLGAATGLLTFTDSALTSPQTVSLGGTGGAPVTLSPASLSFGSILMDESSGARTVTLTNAQPVALSITSVTTAAPFAIASNNCGASLAAGARCTVSVTFSPAAIGAAAGTLSFNDSVGSSPQTVSLSGTGTAPVTLSAASLNFGTVTVGSLSSAKYVTLTNRMSGSLTLTGVVASAGFVITASTCSATLDAGATCTIGIKFKPALAGAAAGTLTFTDSAGNSPQIVNLSGTGQ